MSQIEIEIPLDALRRPNVARALADLALALGGHAVASPHVAAPALMASDARLLETVPAANNDNSASASVVPEEVFSQWIDTLQDPASLKALFKDLQDAGTTGLPIEKVREKFPTGTTNRQVAGAITGVIVRCQQKCNFPAPIVKEGDSYRWRGFPKAA